MSRDLLYLSKSMLTVLEQKIRALHKKAQIIAFNHYVRWGLVHPFIDATVKGTVSFEAFQKFNPYHVPAGSPEGGQFTHGPGGGGEADSNGSIANEGSGSSPRPGEADYVEPGLGHPPVVEALSGITVFGARAVIATVMGLTRAAGSTAKITRAAQSIEEYLGGKPDRIFRNRADDLVIMKGNKKIRFDINNPYPDKEPHFQIERLGDNNKWRDAGPEHRYYFSKEGK